MGSARANDRLYHAVGKLIRAFREIQGITAKGLAERSGVLPQSAAVIAKGQAVHHPRSAHRLSSSNGIRECRKQRQLLELRTERQDPGLDPGNGSARPANGHLCVRAKRESIRKRSNGNPEKQGIAATAPSEALLNVTTEVGTGGAFHVSRNAWLAAVLSSD
jgi:transcriptional regulator with XRE-family HTH domain